MMAQEDESEAKRKHKKSIKYNFINNRDNNRFASFWQNFKAMREKTREENSIKK